MKLLLKAICLIILFASLPASAQKKEQVLFSGKIENNVNKELTLFDVNNNKITIMVDDAGQFRQAVDIAEAGYHRFYDDKDRLAIYFEKGKDVQLSYDPKKFKETVKFSGPGAAANNYLLKKDRMRLKLTQMPGKDSTFNIFSLTEREFKDHYLAMKQAMLKELSATPGLSAQYKRLEAKNINYEYLFFLSQYESVQVNHMNNKSFKATDVLNSELKGLEYNNKEDFLFSEMYRNVIQTIYYDRAGKVSEADKTERDIAYLKALATLDNEYIKNYLLYRFAASYFNYSKDLEGFYQAFMKGSSNKEDQANITKRYEVIKSVVANSASPKFFNYENYAGGTSSLDDFKGKYVFIDVWATWCGPCIYEMPFLDKLEDSYKGKNIHFVTISIDTKANRQKWKDYIKAKDLDGVQLLADDAFNSAFIKAYNITGIPRFLLIDPKGNIVSNNAPRPSDPELRKLLDSLPI